MAEALSVPQGKTNSLGAASDLAFELKFTIDGRDTTAVRRWLRAVCRADPAFPTGVVNSVYYDTWDLHHLREKANGDYLKTKVRLRWYETTGRPAEHSFLEAKLRVGLRRRKVRLETAYSGSWLARVPLHDQALRRIPQELRPMGITVPSLLRAVLHIRYNRDRFVDRLTGARISLDTCITAPTVNRELIASPNPLPLHTAVVEVKGQVTQIPPILRNLIALGGRKTAFSKYRACYDHAVNGFNRPWVAGIVAKG